MSPCDFKVGDLVVYRHATINYFMVVTDNLKIGVISKIYDEDIFASKPKQEPMFMKMALVVWANGVHSKDPVILLERYEGDVKS
tara:strand:- start:494 stop:745 length:252 start_codon:yes stop_codon:yes gene_type:complete